MDFLTCGETRRHTASCLLESLDFLHQDSKLLEKPTETHSKDNDVRINMDFFNNQKNIPLDVAFAGEIHPTVLEKFHTSDMNSLDLSLFNLHSSAKAYENSKDPSFHFTSELNLDFDVKEFGAVLGELVKMDSGEDTPTKHKFKEVRAKRFACPFPGCSTSKRTKAHLDAHIRLHSKGGKRFFSCDECACTFYSSGSLKSHKTTHIRQTETYPCRIDSCGKVYATLEGLRLHNRNYHQVNKPWKCMVYGCASEFVRKADLTLHLIRMHQNQRPFPCKKDGCGKSFASNAELRRHLSRYHHIKQQELTGRKRTSHQVSPFVEEMLDRAKHFREQRDIEENVLLTGSFVESEL